MRLFIHYGLCFLLLILLIPFQAFSTEAKRKPRFARTCPLVRAAAPRQAPTLKISQQNPVVNETKQVTLTAVDGDGNPLTDVAWESGSPEVASVDAQTGRVTGVQYGYATVTARRGGDSVSVFVIVARVKNGQGASVPGDTQTDTGGQFYISDPTGSVILQKSGFGAAAATYAGQSGSSGRVDGTRANARFAGPTAIAVDNGATGGVYVADTLNHSIRKIAGDQVTTVLGTGSPGRMTADATPFAQALFTGPRGIVADTGGNLYVADTSNHAVFYVDFAKREVRLLAGEPGQSGKRDGLGRAVRFTRPAGLALSSDGNLIAVADEGNNRVRLMTRDGQVTTLGKSSSARYSPLFQGLDPERAEALLAQDQPEDEIEFDAPQSVGIDSVGSIYVVDQTNARVVTRPRGRPASVVSLAQDGEGIARAASVTVRGVETFVLDKGAPREEAVKSVSVGPPQITAVTEVISRFSSNIPLEGGTELVVEGKNFAPETDVFVGDGPAVDLVIETATRLRFKVPPQKSPGRKTLSILTRGGVAQGVVNIVPKSFAELSAGEITTYAGGVQFLGDGGKGTEAVGGTMTDLFIDGLGNVYFTDNFNHRIRRLEINGGIVNSIAGNGTGEVSADGGLAVAVGLRRPQSVVGDGQGNLYFIENPRLRRIDARTGLVSTVAGTEEEGFSGDGGAATAARMSMPSDVALDREGNFYIADTGNHRVRRVDAKTGVITTVAGDGKPGFGGDGGAATRAGLNSPSGIAVDDSGNLFITDTRNNRVRRVDASGTITTVAGNGTAAFSGDGGPATRASLLLSPPSGGGSGSVALDRNGTLFIADTGNHRIRRVDGRTGTIATAVGDGKPGFAGDGGAAAAASIAGPLTVTVDGSGNLIFVDLGNGRLRRVDGATGIISTIVGKSFENGDGGLAVGAPFNGPNGLAFDRLGNLLIVDRRSHQIRRVNAATGIITTIAGSNQGLPGGEGDGGPATGALLSEPQGMAVDSAGNLFVADTMTNRIRRIDAVTGIITTVAGNGKPEFSGDGGPAVMAGLNSPTDVAVNPEGVLFIADGLNHRVRVVDPRGVIMTAAGNGKPEFGGDGGPSNLAGVPMPQSVAADRLGNIYVSSMGRIRRIAREGGMITTFAGNGMPGMGPDTGVATAVPLAPSDLVFDTSGNLIVAEETHRIRKIDATGNLTTVAGTGDLGYVGDNGPARSARFHTPLGLLFDSAGNLYVSDHFNNAVRVIKGLTSGGAVAPALAPIADQTVKPGEVRTLKVMASDANGTRGLNLALISNPPYVSLSDTGNGQGTLRIAPGATETRGGQVVVGVTDDTGLSAETSFTVAVLPNTAPTLATIQDQTVTVGEVRAVLVSASDRESVAGLKLALISPPTFAVLTDTGNGSGTIRLAPTAASSGGRVTVQATDAGGLTAQTSFNVTILQNTAPTLAPIADQTVKVGEVRTAAVSATDRENPGGLRLSLVSPPAFVTLSDAGSGTGTIRIAPTAGDKDARITVRAADSGGLTAEVAFNVVVQPAQAAVSITNAGYMSPNLTITGIGFGASGAVVTINGTDVSRFIKNQSATSIALKGKQKKLNLKTGQNQIVVTAGGTASNPFILTL